MIAPGFRSCKSFGAARYQSLRKLFRMYSTFYLDTSIHNCAASPPTIIITMHGMFRKTTSIHILYHSTINHPINHWRKSAFFFNGGDAETQAGYPVFWNVSAIEPANSSHTTYPAQAKRGIKGSGEQRRWTEPMEENQASTQGPFLSATLHYLPTLL